MGKETRGWTYRTVEHLLPLVAPLLNVALERARVERLEQLKAAQQLRRHRHDGAPVVKLAAVLSHVSLDQSYNTLHTGHMPPAGPPEA